MTRSRTPASRGHPLGPAHPDRRGPARGEACERAFCSRFCRKMKRVVFEVPRATPRHAEEPSRHFGSNQWLYLKCLGRRPAMRRAVAALRIQPIGRNRRQASAYGDSIEGRPLCEELAARKSRHSGVAGQQGRRPRRPTGLLGGRSPGLRTSDPVRGTGNPGSPSGWAVSATVIHPVEPSPRWRLKTYRCPPVRASAPAPPLRSGGPGPPARSRR